LSYETWRVVLLVALGGLSLIAYLWASNIPDLRQDTIAFEMAFFFAFVLYLAATILVLQNPFQSSALSLGLVVLFAILFRIQLLPMEPTLSDDMFRYIWDGRVQAQGISPYRYPPNSPQLRSLREGDRSVWSNINRKSDITVYPPAAQVSFAAIWHLVGDEPTGFKAVFVLGEMIAVVPLLLLLRFFNKPLELSIIYLWSPLLIFEIAHSGHLDALVLPLLALSFWARVQERPWLLGTCLGLATGIKLFPALLLPALIPLSRDDRKPALKTMGGFLGVIALSSLPYLMMSGNVFAFVPLYLDQNFNMGMANIAFELAPKLKVDEADLANAITFGGLAVGGLMFLLRPATSGRVALRRCAWIIAWFTLFSQNLFPWYLLWLLPLLALFLGSEGRAGMKPTPMVAWLIFSGTIALAYTFFIDWRVIPAAQRLEFFPLYITLMLAFIVKGIPALRARLQLAATSLWHPRGTTRKDPREPPRL
jgi:alpha-1,6-mannosyltransferase